jgi:hypothetical protein
MTPISQNNLEHKEQSWRAGGVTQMVEFLLSSLEALSSNTSTAKTNEQIKTKKDQNWRAISLRKISSKQLKLLS